MEEVWRNRKKEWPDGRLCLSSLAHLSPWRGLYGAQSQGRSWQCSGNLRHRTLTRSRFEGSSDSAGKMCAWWEDRCSFWSKRRQGWACNQSHTETGKRQRLVMTRRWALEPLKSKAKADSFTYSPSGMHSISSTCPLNTVLELVGPDGMRKDGFLTSAGSSTVTHTFIKRIITSSTAWIQKRVGVQAWTRPFTEAYLIKWVNSLQTTVLIFYG